MRKILTILLTVLMVATLGTVNVFGATYEQTSGEIEVEIDPANSPKTASTDIVVKKGDSVDVKLIAKNLAGFGTFELADSAPAYASVDKDSFAVSDSGTTVSFSGLEAGSGTYRYNVNSFMASGAYIDVNVLVYDIDTVYYVGSQSGNAIVYSASAGTQTVSGLTAADHSQYGGEIAYKVAVNNTGVNVTVATDGKSIEVANGLKPGDYSVTLGAYTQDSESEYYNGSESNSRVDFTVEKAEVECEAPTSKSGLIFSGEMMNLLETAGTFTTLDEEERLGTIEYRVKGPNDADFGAWTSNLDEIQGKKAGQYTVEWKVEETDYYKGLEAQSLTVDIAPAKMFVADQNYEFNFDDNEKQFTLGVNKSQEAEASVSGYAVTTQAIYKNVDFEIVAGSITQTAINDKTAAPELTLADMFSISGTDTEAKLVVSNEVIPGIYKMQIQASASGNKNNYDTTYTKVQKFEVTVTVNKASLKTSTVNFGGPLNVEVDEDLGKTQNNRFINTGSIMYANETTEIKIGDVTLEFGVDYEFGGVMNDVYRSGDDAPKAMKIIALEGSKYIDEETTRNWYIVSSTLLNEQIIVNGGTISKSGSDTPNYFKADQLDLVYNTADQLDELTIVVPAGTTLYVSSEKTNIQNAAHRNEYNKDGKITVASLSGLLKNAGTNRIYFLAIKDGFTSVNGYIDVVVAKADLYALPVYKEIDASLYDPADYTNTHSDIDIQLMRVEKDDSWHEVDATDCLEDNKLYVAVLENIKQIGKYASAVCGTSSCVTDDNYKPVVSYERSTETPYAQKAVVIETEGENAGHVVMDADGKLPAFVNARETFVITANLGANNIVVTTKSGTYNGAVQIPSTSGLEVEVKAKSATDDYLLVPEEYYKVTDPAWWNNFSWFVNAGTYFYNIETLDSSVLKGIKIGNPFVINPKPITVVWENETKEYAGQDSTAALPVASFSGLVGTETLTPYVVYESGTDGLTAYDSASGHKATASISGGQYVYWMQKSWNGTDTAFASNYVLDETPNDVVNYDIDPKPITVVWTGPFEKEYNGLADGIPTASFSGLVDDETLTPMRYPVRSNSGTGNIVSLSGIIDVDVYKIWTKISKANTLGTVSWKQGDTAKPRNYVIEGENATLFKITQLLSEDVTITGTTKVYRNRHETINLKSTAPFASADKLEIYVKEKGALDSTYELVEDKYYTLSEGSTKIAFNKEFTQTLKAGKTYTFKLHYADPQNVGDKTWDVKVVNKSSEKQEEEVVEPTIVAKLVVNTGLDAE